MRLLLGILLFASTWVIGQAPQVPTKMTYAGIKLTITGGARKSMQETVDKLHKSPKHFQQFVDKADLYFPLVESIFAETGFPSDVKYLIIQESAFKAEAVSTSNAVGYWQFKEASGTEVGLHIDRSIDERKNIAAASRGAARYMTKNNVKLDNWIYALLSYHMGLGGVQSEVKQRYIGAKKMEINRSMHWYVLRALAHKVAFEAYVGKQKTETKLITDTGWGGHNLRTVSREYGIELEEFVKHNKWISPNKKIPTDKKYEVIVEVPSGFSAKADNTSVAQHEERKIFKPKPYKKGQTVDKSIRQKVETKKEKNTASKTNKVYSVNGVTAVTAVKGDSYQKLAALGGITGRKFLRYNEMRSFDVIEDGETYFLSRKKRKALVSYHVVQPGETLWGISQEYAIWEWIVRSRNRMSTIEELKVGRKLWLRKTRPGETPIEYDLPKSSDAQIGKEPHTKKEVNRDIPVSPAKAAAVEEEEVKEEEKTSEKVIEKDQDPVKEETKEIVTPFDDVMENSDSQRLENAVKSTKVESKEESGATTMEIEHIVDFGETLFSIARNYGVEVDELKRVNAMENSAITPGMKLKVLVAVEEESEEETELKHTVASGETLFSISRKYRVPWDLIKEWNGLQDNNLSVGQVLIIKQ